MALSIKDPEADRLVRELAAVTGESITDAARKAFAERLQRVNAQRDDSGARRARLQEIVDRARQQPLLDERSPEDVIAYDEHGLPR